jgi:hypothetical protein
MPTAAIRAPWAITLVSRLRGCAAKCETDAEFARSAADREDQHACYANHCDCQSYCGEAAED